MLTLVIITLLLLATVTYFLLAPFYLEVDSERQILRFRFHCIASAAFILPDGVPQIRLKIGPWTRDVQLLTKRRVTGKKNIPHKEKPARPPSFNRIRRLLASFRLTKCYLTFDTGDVQVNGMLFPALWWLRVYSGRDVSVNFTGQSILVLRLENNLARIGLAWIRS